MVRSCKIVALTMVRFCKIVALIVVRSCKIITLTMVRSCKNSSTDRGEVLQNSSTDTSDSGSMREYSLIDLLSLNFGHLNEQSMRTLVREELVDHLDYSTSGVSEACIRGKQSKSPCPFKQSRTVTLMPLELVHSDVCGKMGQKSLGGAEYFLTLSDDKTHYAWVYPLQTKDEVFQHFKEWQAEVESFTGHKVKTLRTDNGGEYTSNSFQAYLKTCGIRHELTIPKTPEQNGVA